MVGEAEVRGLRVTAGAGEEFLEQTARALSAGGTATGTVLKSEVQQSEHGRMLRAVQFVVHARWHFTEHGRNTKDLSRCIGDGGEFGCASS